MSTCEACGRRNAMYVCSSCGRKVCGICFDTSAWACYECIRVPKPIKSVWLDPFLWVMIGFLISFIGVMLIAFSTIEKIATVGGAIFIGPIPIVFGAGPYSILVILIVVLIVVFMLIWAILHLKKFPRG